MPQNVHATDEIINLIEKTIKKTRRMELKAELKRRSREIYSREIRYHHCY